MSPRQLVLTLNGLRKFSDRHNMDYDHHVTIPVEEFERITNQNKQMRQFIQLIADGFWSVEDYEKQKVFATNLILTLD